MNRQQLLKKSAKLYAKAFERFKEEANFSIYDYLTEEEAHEYEKIQFQLGYSNYDPDKE